MAIKIDECELSNNLEDIDKELRYLYVYLPKLISKLKDIKLQLEKCYKSTSLQEQVDGLAYAHLGKALILGGLVGAPATLGLSVAISIFGHILIAYCTASELAVSPTILKIKRFDIRKIVTELEGFKTHCKQAKLFYKSLCQNSINLNDKDDVYLLGTALNELEMRFNTYFYHFDNMEKQEQVADKILHDLNCNIEELSGFQQKISDIREHLHQMRTHCHDGYSLI